MECEQKRRSSCGGLCLNDAISPSPRPDLEKRKNPVCHFVTPLDGSVEVDEHRRPEVRGMWWALTREEVTHKGGTGTEGSGSCRGRMQDRVLGLCCPGSCFDPEKRWRCRGQVASDTPQRLPPSQAGLT